MGFEVGYGAAAFAGLLSFLSPCILPLVPFYLCYLAGLSYEAISEEGALDAHVRRRVILSSVLFALGMTTVFVALGATATTIGRELREWFDVLKYGAAALLALLGLHFLGVFRIGLLHRQARFDLGEHEMGLVGAYFVGAAFAFGWTPCVGPILAAILMTAGTAGTAGEGAALLLVYSAGMTLPFVLAGVFVGPFLRWAKGFRRHLGTVERVSGVFLLAFAALIATDSMNEIAFWMLEYGPDLGVLQ